MDELTDLVVFYEDLTPDQADALREAMQKDPSIAASLQRWQALQSAVHTQLDQDLPDRSLIVLQAMASSGRSDLLSAAERVRLEHAEPAMRKAFSAHPCMEDVLRRISGDCACFDRAWSEWVDGDKASFGSKVRLAPERPSIRPQVRRYWRVAVGVTTFAFALAVLFIVRRDADMVTVQTGVGESQLIALSDGSTIRLQERSRLTYPDPENGGEQRFVRLEGNAFFDVDHQPDRPFTVETEQAVTTVLGTRFGVQAAGKETRVTLASGRVALAPIDQRDHMVLLQPGQMSRVTGGQDPTAPVDVDLTGSLNWTGLFVFEKDTMSDIASLLGKHYGVTISVADDLANETIFGEFDQKQRVDQILEPIAATLGATIVHDGDTITIRRLK